MILRQRVSLGQLTCDIYILPCILECLSIYSFSLFYILYVVFMFLNIILKIIVILTFS